MRRPINLLAPLFVLAPTCLAVGTARVVNNCGTTVYYASVSDNNNAAMKPLPASGYSEAYAVHNGGVSIKMSTSATGQVTQFEFTLGNGQISYDISDINGNPFAEQGMSLVPSVSSSSQYPSCVTVDCPPGASCSAAYNMPDDVATKVCSEDTDLTFTLCTGGQLSNPGTGSSSAGSSSAQGVSTVVTAQSSMAQGISTVVTAKSSTIARSSHGASMNNEASTAASTATAQPLVIVSTVTRASTVIMTRTSTRAQGAVNTGVNDQTQAQATSNVYETDTATTTLEVTTQVQATPSALETDSPWSTSNAIETNAPWSTGQAQSWSHHRSNRNYHRRQAHGHHTH